MKSEKKILFTILGLFFLVSGCQDDKGKNDFSGVSDLISDRNNARYEIAETAPKKKGVSPKKNTAEITKDSKSRSDKRQKELASIILYEEKVDIVRSDSGKILAKGTAYVNKKGQIVRIKILKE